MGEFQALNNRGERGRNGGRVMRVIFDFRHEPLRRCLQKKCSCVDSLDYYVLFYSIAAPWYDPTYNYPPPSA